MFKGLWVLAELPDGTGEVPGACDEVAPRRVQGHASYHSYSQQEVKEVKEEREKDCEVAHIAT